MRSLEVLFAPAEYGHFSGQPLPGTLCAVFDVLRATSTILTALDRGALSVLPVAEIAEALAEKRRDPSVLLAGERHGQRIRADLTGSIDFDFGNSPREFTSERVRGRRLVSTTTNGTRALRACAKADAVLIGALLNVGALAEAIQQRDPDRVLLVCSGTAEDAAYEDALAAGAVVDRLSGRFPADVFGDGAQLARDAYRVHQGDLLTALRTRARNGRRLTAIPDLAEDLPICAALDSLPRVAAMNPEGEVRLIAG